MDSDAYIGEIRLFAGTFAPADWLLCNGASLAINDYQALFSVIGVTYGGNGTTNFAVPDLRGRIPVCMNTDSTAQPTTPIGSMGGFETVQISENNLPSHSHTFSVSTALATSPAPTPNTMAIGAGSSTGPLNLYTTTQKTITPGTLANQTIGDSGLSTPTSHANIMPSLVITYIICNNGIFPARP
ncbi:MAG TPA: phage tail protein [Magnetococcales bacterium]|nr:phage tail protein [Magnetococcales bacterium]